jgi:hypothetical protein
MTVSTESVRVSHCSLQVNFYNFLALDTKKNMLVRRQMSRVVCALLTGGSSCLAAWYSATAGSFTCFNQYCGLGSVFDGTSKCLCTFTLFLIIFSSISQIH